MRNSLVINIFGTHDSKKTVWSSYIFAQLKMLGIDCEYISGFIEEKSFDNPLYVIGKQSYVCSQLFGEVDVIVNESPILMACLYTDRIGLKSAIVEEFVSYGDNNLNILIYDGDEDVEHVESIRNLFNLNGLGYIDFKNDIENCNALIELVLKIIQYSKDEETANT